MRNRWFSLIAVPLLFAGACVDLGDDHQPTTVEPTTEEPVDYKSNPIEPGLPPVQPRPTDPPKKKRQAPARAQVDPSLSPADDADAGDGTLEAELERNDGARVSE